MLFDIRGRRRNVVKVAYAILAILMGASLFLTVGPFNIGEIFNQQTTGDAAEPFEEQQERIQVKLRKDPEDPDLLLAMTRAQINTGNALVRVEPNGQQIMTLEAFQEFQKASATWSDYLKATEEPTAGLAQLVAPTFVRLAENSRNLLESKSNIEAAAEAQKIVAEQRPTLNSLSTLALYTYFTGDIEGGEKAREEAKKLAKTKFERESLETSLGEAKGRAEKFLKSIKQAEKQQQGGAAPAPAGGEPTPESLENPSNPFGGSLGGGGLTE